MYPVLPYLLSLAEQTRDRGRRYTNQRSPNRELGVATYVPSDYREQPVSCRHGNSRWLEECNIELGGVIRDSTPSDRERESILYYESSNTGSKVFHRINTPGDGRHERFCFSSTKGVMQANIALPAWVTTLAIRKKGSFLRGFKGNVTLNGACTPENDSGPLWKGIPQDFVTSKYLPVFILYFFKFRCAG